MRNHPAYKLVPAAMHTSDAEVYNRAGRLDKYRLILPAVQYVLYAVYGYTNSHTDAAHRAKTIRLFDAVLAERERDQQPPCTII